MTWLDIPAFSRLRKQPISGANRFFLSQWATTGSDSVWKTLSASQPSQLVHREVRRSNDPSTLEQRFIPSFMNHPKVLPLIYHLNVDGTEDREALSGSSACSQLTSTSLSLSEPLQESLELQSQSLRWIRHLRLNFDHLINGPVNLLP